MRVLQPVLLLALGLVVLTVVAVGYFMHWLIPAMPLAVAFTLGAIVSPTDAVATVATTETLPLPHRVVAHRQRREPAQRRDRAGRVQARGRRRGRTGLSRLVARSPDNSSSCRAAASSSASSFEWLGRQLRAAADLRVGVGDPVLQTLLTVLIPYAAYMVAEALHVSGILAVVAAGLWASGQEIAGPLGGRRGGTSARSGA